MNEFKLGRLIVPDQRDEQYLMRSVLPTEPETKIYKYWYPDFWWGNQGTTSHCVGFSWTHWLAEGPNPQKSPLTSDGAPYDPHQLYYEAQKVDDFPGENYDGTTVRAGAKVLQSKGLIAGYRWAWSVEDIIPALLHLGPVVVGTNWTSSMFHPDRNGLIRPVGAADGGHAYLLDGINTITGLIRIKNSWGKSWGAKGFAYISIDDMGKLLANRGEACLVMEIAK